jgi:hypothetical protein
MTGLKLLAAAFAVVLIGASAPSASAATVSPSAPERAVDLAASGGLIVDAQMRGRRACHRDWRRYGPNRMVRFVGPRCVREVRRTYRTRPRDRRNCVQVGPLWLCD